MSGVQTAIVEGLAKQIMDIDLPSLMGVKASINPVHVTYMLLRAKFKCLDQTRLHLLCLASYTFMALLKISMLAPSRF